MDHTALNGPPTGHERMVCVISQPATLRTKIEAISDSGSPMTMMTRGLAVRAGLKLSPTNETYGTISQSGLPLAGIAEDVRIQLAPRIAVTWNVKVTPEDTCVMLIGTDIFNAEEVHVETLLGDK